MSKAISIFVLLVLSCAAHSSGSWQIKLDQVCEDDPQKRFALFSVHLHRKHRLASGAEKTYVQNVLELVEVEYTLKPERFENANFKIVKAYNEQAEANQCENLKANNLYTHFNLIHSHYLQYQDRFPRLFEKMQEPIVVRFDQEDYPDFFKGGVATKDLYAANTTCGRLDYEKRRVIGRKEVWFQKSMKQKSKWKRFLPLCFLGILDNSFVCDDQIGIESTLQPHIIYHEYAHLLTSHLFGACRESFFDEALANILAMHFTGEEWLNYKVDQSILAVGFLEHEFLKLDDVVNWGNYSPEELSFSVIPSYFLHLMFFIEKEFGKEKGTEFFLASLLQLTKQKDLNLNDYSIFQRWLEHWPQECQRLEKEQQMQCELKLHSHLNKYKIHLGKHKVFEPMNENQFH